MSRLFLLGRTALNPSALTLVAAALLLGACAVQPTSQDVGDEDAQGSSQAASERDVPLPPIVEAPSDLELYEQRNETLSGIVTWNTRGKIAYRLPDDAGSASLNWQQNNDRTTLRLSGPMGVGATEIRNEGALLRVSRDGIDRLYPADGAPWLPGDQILPIPVNAIRFWLRGQQAPELPVTNAAYENGLLSSLSQGGWLIEYQNYKNVKGLEMPSRLTLLAPDNALSLRIILRNWELN